MMCLKDQRLYICHVYFSYASNLYRDDLFIYSLKIHKQKWRRSKVYCETSRQPFDQSAQLSFLEIKPYGR